MYRIAHSHKNNAQKTHKNAFYNPFSWWRGFYVFADTLEHTQSHTRSHTHINTGRLAALLSHGSASTRSHFKRHGKRRHERVSGDQPWANPAGTHFLHVRLACCSRLIGRTCMWFTLHQPMGSKCQKWLRGKKTKANIKSKPPTFSKTTTTSRSHSMFPTRTPSTLSVIYFILMQYIATKLQQTSIFN